MKECTLCKAVKPLEEFIKAKTSSGYGSRCRPCDLERYKKHRQKNKERIFKQRQEYRRQNAELVAERHRQYYRENREQLLEYTTNWAKQNRTKTRTYGSNRRARLKNAVVDMPPNFWQILLDMYGAKCMNPDCTGEDTLLTHDHVVPLVSGGEHTLANSQILCRSCNSSKFTKTIDYRPNLSNITK